MSKLYGEKEICIKGLVLPASRVSPVRFLGFLARGTWIVSHSSPLKEVLHKTDQKVLFCHGIIFNFPHMGVSPFLITYEKYFYILGNNVHDMKLDWCDMDDILPLFSGILLTGCFSGELETGELPRGAFICDAAQIPAGLGRAGVFHQSRAGWKPPRARWEMPPKMSEETDGFPPQMFYFDSCDTTTTESKTETCFLSVTTPASSNCLFPTGLQGARTPSQAVQGTRLGYSLDGIPGNPHSRTTKNLETPISLTACVWMAGGHQRPQEKPETHVIFGEHARHDSNPHSLPF